MSYNQNQFSGHIDMMGQPIKVGDYIVYSAVDGRSGVLRCAKVIELKFREDKHWNHEKKDYDIVQDPTLLVRAAEQGWGRGPNPIRRKVTLSFMSRVVVVPDSVVTQDFKDAINLQGKWA